MVTTKVKGQGFVPNDLRLKKYTNGSYLSFYEELFQLNPITNYKALDTAGNFIFRLIKIKILNYFLHF